MYFFLSLEEIVQKSLAFQLISVSRSYLHDVRSVYLREAYYRMFPIATAA